MIRINPFRTATFRTTPATLDSVAWGKINFDRNTSTLLFAALRALTPSLRRLSRRRRL